MAVDANYLTAIDISHNPVLEGLGIAGNNLTSLDISANPGLVLLFAYSNSLEVINLSNNPALQRLVADDNLLTTINLSGAPWLQFVDLSYNLLTGLDVSGLYALASLWVDENYLASPDSIIGWREIGLILGGSLIFEPQRETPAYPVFYWNAETGVFYIDNYPAEGWEYVSEYLIASLNMPFILPGGRYFINGVPTVDSSAEIDDARWAFDADGFISGPFTGIHADAIYFYGQNMTEAIYMLENYDVCPDTGETLAGAWNDHTVGSWFAWAYGTIELGGVTYIEWELQFFCRTAQAPVSGLHIAPNLWWGLVHFPYGGEFALANPGSPLIGWVDDRPALEFEFDERGFFVVATYHPMNTPTPLL
jgi:hypothetical protein